MRPHILTSRIQQQRQFARAWLSRHSLIARTELGVQLLRELRHGPSAGWRHTPRFVAPGMIPLPTDASPEAVAEAPIVAPSMIPLPTDASPEVVVEGPIDELPHMPQFVDVPKGAPLASAQAPPLAAEPPDSSSTAAGRDAQSVPPAMPGAPDRATLSRHVWPAAKPAEPSAQRPIRPAHSPEMVVEAAAQVGPGTFTPSASTQAPPNTTVPGVSSLYAADPDADQARSQANSESGQGELPEAAPGMPSDQNVQEQVETAQIGDLFAPRGTDRSPQAWSVRLHGMPSATQLGERASSAPVASKAPVAHRAHATIVDNQPPPAGVAPDRDASAEQLADRLVAEDSARESMSAGSPRAWAARLAQAFSASPSAGPQASAQKAPSAPPFTQRPAGTSAPVAAGAQATESTAGHTQAGRATVAPPRRTPGEPQRAGFPPTPLSDSTRRFLRPLVGIDPAKVDVYRDARANQAAALYAADAITFGDTIWLAAGRGESTPEDLGLLAHELTHILRGGNRRFVPPIVRDAETAAVPYEDEEALAERVEARVASAAREQMQAAWSVHAQANRRLPAYEAPEKAELSPTTPTPPANEPPGIGSSDSPAWGGLPAPWDPLPVWLTAPATVVASQQGTGSPISGAHAGGPQRAPRDRTIPESSEPTQESDATPTPEPQAPMPDLDALAQQVYDALKQRLSMERRREGLY